MLRLTSGPALLGLARRLCRGSAKRAEGVSGLASSSTGRSFLSFPPVGTKRGWDPDPLGGDRLLSSSLVRFYCDGPGNQTEPVGVCFIGLGLLVKCIFC